MSIISLTNTYLAMKRKCLQDVILKWEDFAIILSHFSISKNCFLLHSSLIKKNSKSWSKKSRLKWSSTHRITRVASTIMATLLGCLEVKMKMRRILSRLNHNHQLFLKILTTVKLQIRVMKTWILIELCVLQKTLREVKRRIPMLN